MNSITHIEIPAPDLQKAIDFYGKIFDWQIQVVEPNRYAFFRIGEGNSGGGFDASLQPAPERIGHQIVVDVDDIDLTLQQIINAGGQKILEKTEIPGGHGFYAVFKDPQGNSMQLHSRT